MSHESKFIQSAISLRGKGRSTGTYRLHRHSSLVSFFHLILFKSSNIQQKIAWLKKPMTCGSYVHISKTTLKTTQNFFFGGGGYGEYFFVFCLVFEFQWIFQILQQEV